MPSTATSVALPFSASLPVRVECERLVGAALHALERFGAGAEVLRQAARFTAARRT